MFVGVKVRGVVESMGGSKSLGGSEAFRFIPYLFTTGLY